MSIRFTAETYAPTLQLVPMLGLAQYVHGSTITPFEKLILIIENIKNTSLWTASLSLISLTWLIGARLLKQNLRGRLPVLKYIPEIFILVVVATGGFALLTYQLRMLTASSSFKFSAHRSLQARLEGYRGPRQIGSGKGAAFRLAFSAKALEIRS
jgi:MFS superfamily sulfate permease-like transporter